MVLGLAVPLLRLLPRLQLRLLLLLLLVLLPLPRLLLHLLPLRGLGRLLLLRLLRLLRLHLSLILRLRLGPRIEVRDDCSPGERPLPYEVPVEVDKLLELLGSEVEPGDFPADFLLRNRPSQNFGSLQVGRGCTLRHFAPFTRDDPSKAVGVFSLAVIAIGGNRRRHIRSPLMA